MSLQKTIDTDLRKAIAAGEMGSETRDLLKVIVGELQRQQKKILSDDEVVKILRQLEKSELEVLNRIGEDKSKYLEMIRKYLPTMAPDFEISEWISVNIDFTKLNNPLQAVGSVMKHFGARADGNNVRELIKAITGS
jgi:uncharacterized protein YqeY